MPDRRTHRGPGPKDEQLFGAAARAKLGRAVRDFSWLLSRGYADKSSLKLVCDHDGLTQRQRGAVMRSGCSDQARAERLSKQVGAQDVAGRTLMLDGFNVLTTLEAALGGAVVLRGRDGCLRDIAGLHGTYRTVEETVPALEWAGRCGVRLRVGRCRWYLDRPVSNSGRLKQLLLAVAERNGWDWQVEVVYSPDHMLVETEEIVVTADSEVLNRCGRWFNMAEAIRETEIDDCFLVDLSLRGQVRV